MLVEFPNMKDYLIGALEASPAVIAHLLDGVTREEADRRPDPSRFTLREIVAHLADWELIFGERLRRTLTEENPVLPSIDEGELAIEHGYGKSDLAEQLRLFSDRRAQTAALARGLSPDEWNRTAVRPDVGTFTMEALVTLIPLHDAYHIRQIAEWRNGPRPAR